MASREEHWEERLALPVLVAALAAIPAMFLTLAEGALGTAGHVVDLLSGVVLVGETVILLVVAENKRAWIRCHLGLIALTLLVIVAVVLAVGPVQVLRLVRTVGALRILRAGRIVKAARSVTDRMGFTGNLAHLASAGAGVLVAVFVGVVLADPTSRSRDLLSAVLGEPSTALIVVLSAVAGVILGAATYLLARDTGSDTDEGTADELAARS
jgi:CsoR family transcriptional regulator, copper-sensing transcriptional repressor